MIGTKHKIHVCGVDCEGVACSKGGYPIQTTEQDSRRQTMIDIEQIRTVTSDMSQNIGTKTRAWLRECCDEIEKYRLDTAPLSREELETVLKEAGWVANSKYIRQFNCPNHTGWIDIEQDCEKPMFHFASVTVPPSAVTRRLLRDCGVIA